MDITSNFKSLKVSALEKASRISAMMNCTTIDPQSVPRKDDSDKLENIENEQNSCNIKSPEKTNISPKHNTIATSNGIHFSIKKIILESEKQRKEEVRVTYSIHILIIFIKKLILLHMKIFLLLNIIKKWETSISYLLL